MKTIAVASDADLIAGHFGHCEGFSLFATDGEKVISKERVVNPGHKPGFLPNFLQDLGVDVIIAGGMGEGATSRFAEKNMEVIVGAKGSIDGAVEAYLKGELVSTGSVCHEHQHRGECGGHHGDRHKC